MRHRVTFRRVAICSVAWSIHDGVRYLALHDTQFSHDKFTSWELLTQAWCP